ncbi:phage scaffolding protein [Bacillus subtilis]|uniref:phage scaffolding protein n=1 Tax=Bacillus subtilis TaxID=1423 RepID=UPI002577480E|nr:phage scaffolding protein [Bacillus subtilis]
MDERDEELSTLQKEGKGNEEVQAGIEELEEDKRKSGEEYEEKLDEEGFDFGIE